MSSHSAEHEIHLPPPSIAPVILAGGVTIVMVGLIMFLKQFGPLIAGPSDDARGGLVAGSLIGGAILLGGLGVLMYGLWRMAHFTEMEEHPTMGVSSRLLGMWIFLASEIMFFSGLITTFMGYRARTAEVLKDLNVPLMTVGTFVLLSSSLAAVTALAAIQRGNTRAFRTRIIATLILGAAFLTIEALEWIELFGEGIDGTTLFGSAFFTLTGFHGMHVIVGLIWLGLILFRLRRDEITSKSSMGIEIFGLYWHFVDVVWIILFTVIYLLR